MQSLYTGKIRALLVTFACPKRVTLSFRGTVPVWGQWAFMSHWQCFPVDFVASLAGGFGKQPHLLYLSLSVANYSYLAEKVGISTLIWLTIGHEIANGDWALRDKSIMHRPNGLSDHSWKPKCLFYPIPAYYLSPTRNAHRADLCLEIG